MVAIIITSIVCATLLIGLYIIKIYPRTIRRYKKLAAQYMVELDQLRKEYETRLDGYTDWFREMEKRLRELANIVYDKVNEK